MFDNKKIKELKEELSEKDKEILELKRQNNILKGIQSAMPDPYYVRDMDYNIILWTKAMEKLTGYSEEEAKKIKCYDIFKADVCKDCATQKCVLSRQFLKDAAVDIYNKDNDSITTLVSNAGVYDDNGNPVGAVEIIKDSTRYKDLISSVESNSEQISSVAEQLAASSEEVVALSNEINEQALEISNEAKKGVNTADEVQHKTSNCTEFANNVMHNMQTINKSMKTSVAKINDLKEKSELIVSIVTTIQGIASQTNLLALNASIEAARAGEHGKGFAVVADEIRKLAEGSNDSAGEINKTIDDIINVVKETVIFSTETEKSLESGRADIERLLQFIEGISLSSNQMLQLVKNIEEVTSQGSESSKNQKMAMEDIARASQHLADIAQTLKSDFESEIKKVSYDKM
ncbi:PAS domain-containing methyl-accepting chemotaxis protein [Clostridium sp. ZS2-4]|uniref:PAS domain-containing methyl-accepting chemotaxis protein n=1 Tax=Clostridium sp. ZS2-4 TaxID=2987703 RepID=UPI00227A8CA6|nr:PAS domain-containing methyl-accepting chemotaxis protein [Clostridium sp. ZS2-4]MCY6355227.1 PAS domain-containing methyl-accepting chemotaxis protein [Clostridium sp. ZS2-4]